MLDVVTLDTPSLGDRSYLATDGRVAVVVDPQRDHDRVLAIAAERGLTITHVLETHIHNDYVTGGYALASEVGAAYCVNAADEVSYERTPVSDGDVVVTGDLTVRVLATPGHTFTHLSFAVSDRDGRTVVFTGGSLLYGSTGRPDLLGTEHAEALARHQHASAHRLVEELPGTAVVFPTHGFGSFCTATTATTTATEQAPTLEQESRTNPALTADVETWVEQTLAGLTAYPAYYSHMAPANSTGPGPVDLSPPEPADPAELRRRIDAGEWVVDLRSRTAFATGHLRGSLSFGLDGAFVTYLGWLIPWGTPVTLLAATPEDLEAAQRDLARIGIDRPAAAATGTVEEWSGGEPVASFPVVAFGDLATARMQGAGPAVLDVRRDDERTALAVAGSQHIPLHDLPSRLDEVPTGEPVWVHCATGYRATVAAGLLQRAGRDVVLVDDDVEKAAAAGLELVA